MKTRTTALLAGVVFAAFSGVAAAEARINVDVNLGLPGFGYAAPQPVYYPPQVFYAPAPRIVRHHHDRDWDRHHRFDERHNRYDDRRHW